MTAMVGRRTNSKLAWAQQASAVIMVVSVGSGCAGLKKEIADLKIEKAALQAQLDCCGDEKSAMQEEIDRERTRADEAESRARESAMAGAAAEGRLASEAARADACKEQLDDAAQRASDQQARFDALVDRLEKAWKKTGRQRSLTQDLLRLKRAGVDWELDACTDCDDKVVVDGS